MKKRSLEQSKEYAMSKAEGFGQHAKDLDYIAQSVPCQAACPADTDIPGYLEAIAQGNYREAYRINLRDNVFPAVLGRVCTRPCEPVCRHGAEGNGDPVAICFSKRSAETFMEDKEPLLLEPLFDSTGKKVAVVGSGAAGLTLARELTLWGHAVTLLDKNDYPGGNMMDAIPDFRLPRDIVKKEIDQVLSLGMELRLETEVGKDVSFAELQSEFDSVIISAGTLKPNMPDFPGADLDGVMHGVEFLNGVNLSGSASVGKHIAVIGGGFTAVDCARITKRLGSESSCMYYRRTHTEMYITELELHEFKAEGVDHQFQVAPIKANGVDGKLCSVTFARTQMGEPDDEGRSRPENIPGSEFDVETDMLLCGTGQFPTEGLPVEEGDGVFIAGDYGTGARSLIDAIGSAKSVARKVDHYLMGRSRFRDGVLIEEVDQTSTGRTLEMDAYPRNDMPMRPSDQRGLKDEVEVGLDDLLSKNEAERCYLCNYKFEIDNDLCIYCDRCLKVMPVENCIVKVSSLLYDDADRINGFIKSSSSRDYNHLYLDQSACIRCGACVEVCPVDCITLQKTTKVCLPEKE